MRSKHSTLSGVLKRLGTMMIGLISVVLCPSARLLECMRRSLGIARFTPMLAGLVVAIVARSPFAFAQPGGIALPRPIVRDSAGIRIVEYPTLSPVLPPHGSVQNNPFSLNLLRLPAAIRLDQKAYFDIGGLREKEIEEFDSSHPLLTATHLSNGTIVVNDHHQLKFFTSTGTFVRAVGRRGRGPGEFTQTQEVCRLRGDSLLVRDMDGRLTVWDSSGVHVRTYARLRGLLSSGCREDGALILSALGNFSRGGDSTEYTLVGRDGTTLKHLGRLPSVRVAGAVVWQPSIIIRGNDMWVANARTWEIRVQSVDGRVRQITRLTKPAPIVTDADWRRRAELQTPKDLSREARASSIARKVAAKPNGPYPALSTVIVDPKKRVWVSDFESASGWTILDAQGTIRGRFTLRGAGIARIWLVGVSENHIVVYEDDDDGGVHLRYYRYAMNF